MKMKTFFLLVVSLSCCQISTAQSLVEAPMFAQAQMRMGKDGHMDSCGMQITGFSDAGSQRYLFDTSLMITKSGYGYGKIAGLVGATTDSLKNFHEVEVYGGWFRKQGGDPTMPLKPYINGEDKKSKLFVAGTEPTMQVFDAITAGLPIHLSISWHKGTSVIYFGTPQMEAPQRDQFVACVGDLIKVMSAEQGGAGRK